MSANPAARDSPAASVPRSALAVAAAWALGALGCIPVGGGVEPLVLLVWLALVAPAAGALLAAGGSALWPWAAAVPVGWGLLLAVTCGARVPDPAWAAAAWTGLYLVGFALARLAAPGRWSIAALLLVLDALLVGLPGRGGVADDTHGGFARLSPRAASAVLDCSPATLVVECAGFDWMRHRSVYQPAGTDWYSGERAAYSGARHGGTVLAIGVVVALLAELGAQRRARQGARPPGTPGGLSAALWLPLALGAPGAAPQTPEPDPPRVERVLAVDDTGPRGRTPIVVDALLALRAQRAQLAQLANEECAPPAAGDELAMPDGSQRVWRELAPEADGSYALASGWASATVSAASAGVWMLAVRGASMLYARGEPRIGDVYEWGITEVPILLDAGQNELLFRAGRGRLAFSFRAPPDTLFLDARDATVPDLVRPEDAGRLALMVVNASTSAVESFTLGCRQPGGQPDSWRTSAGLPPLSFRKEWTRFVVPADAGPPSAPTAIALLPGNFEPASQTLAVDVPFVEGGAARRVVFHSAIDGSLQSYALLPARSDSPATEEVAGSGSPGLIVALHGASVDALSQARAYVAKDWAHVIAPQNRRPFGFDWEDWGRDDAREAITNAERTLAPDPLRRWLTGHSMGGHGTWSLGVFSPGEFAALAPSAGWREFSTYGGGPGLDPGDPVQAILDRAANASRTSLFYENLAEAGVYVLHGDADDNVPVSEARAMRAELERFHGDFDTWEQPGAGHWWGNECVDFPPLMDFLRARSLPDPSSVRAFAFSTPNPAILSRSHWAAIEAQQRSLVPSRLEVALDLEARRLVALTQNCERVSFDVGSLGLATDFDGPIVPALTLVIDGAEILAKGSPDGVLRLARLGQGRWGTVAAFDPRHKTPLRCGPFKEVFRRCTLVFGTQGTPEENAWAYAKARYDAETFWYRANGDLDLAADVEFDTDRGGGSVVLYGNADTHADWSPLFGGSPVQVRRGAVHIGARAIEGSDLAVLAIHPRPGSSQASVACVAASGPAGQCLADVLPLFVSGVHWPDWTVVGAETLERGAAGIRAAGFYGPDWSLASGAQAFR